MSEDDEESDENETKSYSVFNHRNASHVRVHATRVYRYPEGSLAPYLG